MQRRFQTAAINRLTLSGGQPRVLRIVLAAQNSTGMLAVVHCGGKSGQVPMAAREARILRDCGRLRK